MDEEAQRTLFCGNLDSRVTPDILYELFLQAGPLEKVKIPDGKSFGFVTFNHPISVEYTIRLMDGIRLFNKILRLQPRTGGANSTPNRQNSTGSNMNMMQNGNNFGGNMAANMVGNMGGMTAVQGLMGMSPFHRSYSAPQFQSTPNRQNQRFQEDSGGTRRNDIPDHRDRSNERQMDRDRNNRDYKHRDQSRDRDRERDRDRSFDRSYERDQGGRDNGYSREKGRNQSRDYGRDRGGRDREWDNNRDRSQDRSSGGNFNRGESFPQTQRYQQQQHLTRQSGFDQDSVAMSIESELRRQRNQQQQQQFMQAEFQKQMQEAIQNNFGRPQQRNQGQGRYGRRY